LEGNLAQLKLNGARIATHPFAEARPDLGVNLECSADDPMGPWIAFF
jgi:hypothetical protein